MIWASVQSDAHLFSCGYVSEISSDTLPAGSRWSWVTQIRHVDDALRSLYSRAKPRIPMLDQRLEELPGFCIDMPRACKERVDVSHPKNTIIYTRV